MWRWPCARRSAREQGSKGPQVRALKRCNSSRPSEVGWRWECQPSNFLVGDLNGKTACRPELRGEGPETKGLCKESCNLPQSCDNPNTAELRSLQNTGWRGKGVSTLSSCSIQWEAIDLNSNLGSAATRAV